MPRTRIEYWEKWGGGERDAMGGIVQAFNCSQDEHEVVMHDTGDWSSSPDLPRFLSAQASGTPPDVIGLEGHQIVDLACKGALAALDSSVNLSACRPEFVSLGTCSERLYGAPVSVDIVTLYVNLSAVRGTAFDGGKMPLTLNEFDSALRQVEASTGKLVLVPAYPGWWPHAWAWFFGGSWVDEEGKFTPARPENVSAFEWIQGIRDRLVACGVPGRETIGRLLGGPINPIGRLQPDPFLSGEVAMVLEGDWLVRRLVAYPGLEWAPAAFPCADGSPSALLVGDVLAVPAGSANPSGAAEFIRFATRPEQLERLALGQGKISPLVDWSAEFMARHPNPHIREFRDILASAELFHDPRLPGWLSYLDGIKKAFAEVWAGRGTPQQVLADLRHFQPEAECADKHGPSSPAARPGTAARTDVLDK